MSYRQVTDTLLDVARRIEKDMTIARAYVKEHDFFARMHRGDLDVDYRDFLPMLTLMGIEGETEEARTADIHKKLEELAVAFEDPNRKSREKYLAMIYHLMDDFGSTIDPTSLNMSNPEDVKKLLQTMLLSQTIAVKRRENPGFFERRYPTSEERTLIDARMNYSLSVGYTVSTNIVNNGIKIDCILSLPQVIPEEAMEIHHFQENHVRGVMEKAIAANGNLPKTNVVEFPILDSLIPSCGKNMADVEKLSNEDYDLTKNYFSFVVEGTMLQRGSKELDGLKAAKLGNEKHAVYIDGKPFLDMMNERFPNKKGDGIQDVVAGTCFLGGKHKVDIVTAYRDKNGVLQYEAKTVRPTVTPEQEQLYKMQFSWLRRNLFNWGPFRIVPLQERLDKLASDPNTDARLADVKEHFKAKIEAKIAADELVEQASKEIKLRESRRMEAYSEAVNRMEESAAQWNKDSVIGVLGQQIAGEKKADDSTATGICAMIRRKITLGDAKNWYKEMSPLFAKVVLYSQLCYDREMNDGEPGELESLLEGGNSIEENINHTARRLADDVAFKNVVLKKIGVEEKDHLIPNRQKFEDLVGSNGCRGIWVEYNQKVKELTGQNEQLAPSNERQAENQKKQEEPKAMVQ